jgi:pyruvate-ferredoxin/flavodoxin oxidoreductase
MGSAARTVEETIDYLNERGYKAGVMEVKLYRPWPAEFFVNELPKTTKQICVLDRTREDGAN